MINDKIKYNINKFNIILLNLNFISYIKYE